MNRRFHNLGFLYGVVLNGCGRGMWICVVGIPSRSKAHIGIVCREQRHQHPSLAEYNLIQVHIFTNVDLSVNFEGPVLMLLNGVPL